VLYFTEPCSTEQMFLIFIYFTHAPPCKLIACHIALCFDRIRQCILVVNVTVNSVHWCDWCVGLRWKC